MKRCIGGCAGKPRPRKIRQTFTRKGSLVEVTIKGIPAEVCPVCGEAFLTPEVSQQIDHLLEPFHGHHNDIPPMPPARVEIAFAEALEAVGVS